jgi:hypothetical protein
MPQSKPVKTLSLQEGAGPLSLSVFIISAGKDIQIYLGGGTAPHIGSVAISQPRPRLNDPEHISCTTSIHNILGHKDDVIAVLFAEGFCKEFNCLTVASAGVHIDGAGTKEIKQIMNLAKILLEKSLAGWKP